MNLLPLSLLLAAIVAALTLSSCVSVKSEEPVTTTRTTTTVDTPVSPGASVTRTTTTY